MRLKYNGPIAIGAAAFVIVALSIPIFSFVGTLAGMDVVLVGAAAYIVQVRVEAEWWKRKCEIQIDVGIERALRAELPRLLGEKAVRTDKLSTMVQDAVDEMKD